MFINTTVLNIPPPSFKKKTVEWWMIGVFFILLIPKYR